jgi:release factor glutamine methyltransferase
MIYSPRDDSFLLKKQVSKLTRSKSFLDMGSGSGIQAEAALENGAKSILAVDINSDSIKHLKKKKIPTIKSDLFSNVKGKFDLIAFNPPYLPEDDREDNQSKRTTTGGEKGDEIILRFLEQAQSHLNNNGIILLLVSSLTPKNKIIVLLKKLNLKKRKLSEQKLFMEKIEVWEVKKIN